MRPEGSGASEAGPGLVPRSRPAPPYTHVRKRAQRDTEATDEDAVGI